MMTSEDAPRYIQLDPVTAAAAAAKKRAEDALESGSASASTPGLPPPADHAWVEQQLARMNKPSGPPTIGSPEARAILKPRRGKGVLRKNSMAAQVDRSLGLEDWQKVYKEYGKTGDEQMIAFETGLTMDQVEHLLSYGLRRLHLPAIVDHATNDATVQLALEATSQDLTNTANKELDIPEVQRAATKRAVQEASIALRGLEINSAVGRMMEVWIDKITQLMDQDAFTVGTQVTPELLERLVRTLDVHARTTAQAIKTYRLARGEPTEIVMHQVLGMLASCSEEELRAADETGDIPARLLGRFASPASFVDANFEEVQDSESTKDEE